MKTDKIEYIQDIADEAIKLLLSLPSRKKINIDEGEIEISAYWAGTIIRVDIKGVKEE